MNRLYYLLSLSLLILAPTACDTTPVMEEEEEMEEVGEPIYDFDSPEFNIDLPPLLGEISGIDFINDSTLVAVHDEVGFVYFIDSETGVLKSNINWGAAGDYEDIEVVENHIWILRSDGVLFDLMLNDDNELQNVTEHATFLLGANDTEGLTYDSENNHLLIACKESPGIGYSGFTRTIYAFDLDTNTLQTEAVLAIDFEEVDGTAPIEGYSVSSFKPSAIDIHPSTKNWYVMSSQRKGVLVFKEGQLDGVSLWDDSLFRKPEGLAFHANGDIYIANEADGREPALIKFAMTSEN